MEKIQIWEARKIADRIGAEAVVVIAFGGERFAATSYGATKAKCAITARWLDRFVEDMTSGKIDAPSY